VPEITRAIRGAVRRTIRPLQVTTGSPGGPPAKNEVPEIERANRGATAAPTRCCVIAPVVCCYVTIRAGAGQPAPRGARHQARESRRHCGSDAVLCIAQLLRDDPHRPPKKTGARRPSTRVIATDVCCYVTIRALASRPK
jgi:hypothetical protein